MHINISSNLLNPIARAFMKADQLFGRQPGTATVTAIDGSLVIDYHPNGGDSAPTYRITVNEEGHIAETELLRPGEVPD